MITLTLEENIALLERRMGSRTTGDHEVLLDVVSKLLPQFEMRMMEQARYEN
tara:strand:+ start:301 stop:456 length:156 start_codon:yes stop_codon:yes gene_type:complete